MPYIASSSVVIPKKLAADEKERFIDALYEVQAEVFDGVDRQAFARYVVDSSAESTEILVHKSEQGRIVGYFAMHLFIRQLAGKDAAILRAEAGILRAYRGRNSNTRFGVSVGLKQVLGNPGRPTYYLGSLVHPSSYSLFASYAHRLWPNPDTPTPPALISFMCQLGDEFGLEVVDDAHPLVRRVGWRTRDSDVERQYWRHCDKPAARFFVAANPGYIEGHGLLTLIPLSAADMLRFAGRAAGTGLRRRGEAAMATLQRLPIGKHLVRPAVVRRKLAAAPFFASFDAATLDTIVRTAEVVSLRAGLFLFRENDAGSDMYLIARGAVYVLSGPPGQEIIIDELGSGALFGEIAMLTGSRRTASIRTASATTLVRIRRDTFFPIMEEHADVAAAVWQSFVARLFDDYIRGAGHHEHLDRAQRFAWVARGRHDKLAADTAITVDSAGFLFVVSGTVEIAQGENSEPSARYRALAALPALPDRSDDRRTMWMTSSAPLLLEVVHPIRVRARSTARIVIIPKL